MRRAAKSRRQEGGFTLLEVMVAVAILAVGVVPLLVTHATTVANIRRARELSLGVLIARSRIASLEARGYTLLAIESGLGMEGDEEDEDCPPFLEVGVELKETEPEALVAAQVSVSRRHRRPEASVESAAPARAEIELNTSIVNLYFEEEAAEEEESS